MAERKRDVEAIGIASEIADSIQATDDGRRTGILVGMRAYRRGRNESAARVTDLEAQVAKLTLALRRAEQRAGWTPAEASYVHTLKRYGMTLPDIAGVMGVGIDDVQEALRLAVSKRIRKAVDRKPRQPGKRALDAG